MDDFKLLFDTNIIIGLEDPGPIRESLAALVRLSNEFGIDLFIDAATYDDISRDRDTARRDAMLSRLEKFQCLREVPAPSDHVLAAKFGRINSINDRADVRLLLALDARAADFLITEDTALHRRSEKAQISDRVFTVEEALDWIRRTFKRQSVSLPMVLDRKAYQIDTSTDIFCSLREDYPTFDLWFDRCRREHRDCWVLEIDGELAGIIIRKDEQHNEAHTSHPGPKILKICTFKVRDENRGERLGELLLKQVTWFAQRNGYDLIYVTAFPKHALLVDFLQYFGFSKTRELKTGEWMLEKPVLKATVSSINEPPLDFARQYYPRFYDGPEVRKFCIPIIPEYHQRLFPEIAFGRPLPLFPESSTQPFPAHSPAREHKPGNTIRKVYLCRAKASRMRRGDILLFYMSKDEAYAASQSITTLAVVEQVAVLVDADELVRHTAKRSVYSGEELKAMCTRRPPGIRVIDFMLMGHLEHFVSLKTLVERNVFNRRPPQSVLELTGKRYEALCPFMKFGY